MILPKNNFEENHVNMFKVKSDFGKKYECTYETELRLIQNCEHNTLFATPFLCKLFFS